MYLAKNKFPNLNLTGKTMLTAAIGVILLLGAMLALKAQNTNGQPDDIYSLSLNELLNIKVKTPSVLLQNVRESPGVVSVLTRKDILQSGARDLMELLHLIPGIDFGAEWDNILGIGIRGTNATEGKVLILLDDHILNESNFGIFPFGNHISASVIERIEVLRGPGSVKYGGLAELAVIRITTINQAQAPHVYADFSQGIENGKSSGSQLSGAVKKELTKNWDLAFWYAGFLGNRSNSLYQTLDSTTINYADSSEIISQQISAQISHKDITLNLFYDNHQVENTELQGKIWFENFHAGLSYNKNFSSKNSFSSNLNYARQKPWHFVDYHAKELYNTINQSIYLTTSYKHNINQDFGIMLGLNADLNSAEKVLTDSYFNNGKNHIAYNMQAIFAEAGYRLSWANISAGFRLQNHSRTGLNLVPRLAFTRSFESFNYKIMLNKAFKSPTIANFDYNPQIKPEQTTVYELEAGKILNRHNSITINLFHIEIENPILYMPSPVTQGDYYDNFGLTGTRGLELSYKYKKKAANLSLGYSFYKLFDNQVEQYQVEHVPGSSSAFPQHKLFMNAIVQAGNHASLVFDWQLFGTRYTYIHADKQWNTYQLQTYEPEILSSVFLSLSDKSKKWQGKIGVYNLSNAQIPYLNAYKGMQNPIPRPGRQFVLKISYKI